MSTNFSLKNNIAVISLNRPSSLNSLNLEMVNAIRAKLSEWKVDPEVKAVVLTSSSDAFCAGGDVKEVVQQALTGNTTYAKDFFSNEYKLNLEMRTFPKPTFSFGKKYIFGGGLGLFSAANFRILSGPVKISMPEIFIGFFPDVGAAYFLKKICPQISNFMMLSGASILAGDALKNNLATHRVNGVSFETFLSKIEACAANAPKAQLKQKLAETLDQLQSQSDMADMLTTTVPDFVYECDGFNEKLSTAVRESVRAKNLQPLQNLNPQVAKAFETSFNDGSKYAMLGITEHIKNCQGKSLEEVLNLDLELALELCKPGSDFIAGVSAKLIHKTKPIWRTDF